jgi:long-chain acyl-CoA synthetase
MNVFEIIKNEARKHQHLTAVMEREDQITYGQLTAFSEQVAESLKSHGVCSLQRVALLCDDSIDYIIVSLAILSLNAVIVPVSPEQSADEMKIVIERIDVDFIIAELKLREGGRSIPLLSDGLIAKEFSIERRTVSKPPPSGYFDSNPAFIRFSSGTTGMSKGVLLSHNTIIERTAAADKGLQITPQDTVLWVLSMSYHFVVTILLFLQRGCRIVLCGHSFPEAFFSGIVEQQATFIYASPFHYNLLSQMDELSGDAMKHVRIAISTTMKLPESVAEAFANKFDLELTEGYGIIEVGLPFIRLSGGKSKRNSVGRALPDYRIRLVNQDSTGIGEIYIQGAGMIDAYYSPWMARDEILSDGWFKTGDLGKLDEDGFLYIVGRDKEVINFLGMKIFAQEVEAVINQHPQVRESMVYGLPHTRYGELPIANVVLEEGCEAAVALQSLRSFCYERMAQYKAPKEFKIVDHLTRTASGKIKRTLH